MESNDQRPVAIMGSGLATAMQTPVAPALSQMVENNQGQGAMAAAQMYSQKFAKMRKQCKNNLDGLESEGERLRLVIAELSRKI